MLNLFNDLLPTTAEMERSFDKLWPLCRSITGNGFRQSLKILQEQIPYEQLEIPTGTKVFDWTVPKEWNIEDAWIEDSSGKKVVDFKSNNLHVMNYSAPIDVQLTLEELDAHLHSLPDQPDAIPYLTSYYKERWGFCLTHKQRKQLQPGKYRAVVKSSLKEGALTLGHTVLPATVKTDQEILISTYLCHPSMANNELSGPIVSMYLYRALSKLPERKFNIRFVVGPETIGSITYLSKFGSHLAKNLKHGLILTCCGDGRILSYKESRIGNATIDRVMRNILKHSGKKYQIQSFTPAGGSDERQYCSPGFNFPVGVFYNSAPGDFPEYHTSLDNKTAISFEAMRSNILILLQAIHALDSDKTYVNTVMTGEPMLGPRGLYPTLGSQKSREEGIDKMMWILNFSDGKHTLGDIAEKSGFPISELAATAEKLKEAKLLCVE